MTQQVILVDDDPVQRRLLESHVSRMGYRTITCDNGQAALDALRIALPDRRPAAMVLDLAMPGIGGMEVMEEMRRAGLDVPVVVQTATGGIETAVAAMRAGAFDFVVKPAAPERLRQIIERAVRSRRSPAAAVTSAKRLATIDFAEAGAAMRPILSRAGRAAASTAPLLIEGETGVGKEWLAEAVRLAGPRAAAPFVTINCGALPASLAESILFGHAKGAFTDASERRIGRFAAADGGTLFLDEIGELPLDIQAKLLRVLQNGEIDPIGGSPARVDVRVVSATNRMLETEVAAGRFREDLLYRLNVLSVRIPPLRERRDEIVPLALRFLDELGRTERPGRVSTIASDALRALEAFDWPGNIRQLQNAVHRAVVMAEGDKLGIEDFPQVGPSPVERSALPPIAAPEPICQSTEVRTASEPAVPALEAFDAAGQIRRADAVEADLIRLAVLRYGGHLSEVARRLGIGRSTLYRKMREYGFQPAEAE
ncbi:sigma-54-dependent transcriptional regulator [Aureimonas leprariae]|uniref:DNA-binding transcriptional regulator NtrC n=1 Tax=Plantimonas leprariae TaxID=2615207 RepID=A0A7V7PMU9_9HYPH|nr:sigma-54 dependent transcriptional regulator [Aureimonas leprariae]KAB0678765.1 sigma-54-dependent Fis family transcriptional regulator [Aureimonas leprariae]